VSLGAPETSGQGERVPIYLSATGNLAGVAVTFALGDQHSQLHFLASPDTPPSLVQDSQLGVVAAVWANGVSVRGGSRLLLGYVEGPAGVAANLTVYGASGSGVGDNREVRLATSPRDSVQ
jgi:Na+/serine symporter